jgi:hypothetical protein
MLTVFPLTEWVQLKLRENLGKGRDGLGRPLVLGHQWNEGVLRHGHLTKAEVGIWDDVL